MSCLPRTSPAIEPIATLVGLSHLESVTPLSCSGALVATADGSGRLAQPTLAFDRLYPTARHLPARVRLFADWLVEFYAAEAETASRFLSEAEARTLSTP